VAAVGSWPGIERHGLRSTTALLDLFEVAGSDRERIESQHRPESETIHHPRYGTAVIRDQKPMSDGGLVRALQDGLKPRDWYRILNKKVFFWLTRERLETLVNAREYREEPAVDYLVLNVVSLVFHVEEVGGQLTNMNDAVFKIQTL
jgi:hypothetical protein